MADSYGAVHQLLFVPRGLLQALVADLWAYHNDDDACDGECPTMSAVRRANALMMQVPVLATTDTITVRTTQGGQTDG